MYMKIEHSENKKMHNTLFKVMYNIIKNRPARHLRFLFGTIY